MPGQTASATHANATELSLREAFVSLLIASARSDGSVSPREANQIEDIVAAMKLFRGSSPEARYSLFERAAQQITQEGIEAVVRTAAAVIPKELTATAFAMAVDLMLSDGPLTANERQFADELCGLLDVDAATAAKIVDVLTIKNAG